MRFALNSETFSLNANETHEPRSLTHEGIQKSNKSMKKSIWPTEIKQKSTKALKIPKIYDLDYWWEEDKDIFIIKNYVKRSCD